MENLSPLQQWLTLHQEAIIDPEREIVDPHHHLWRYVSPEIDPYLLKDLWADAATGHNITKTIFMECRAEYLTEGPEHLRAVGETEFVTKMAKESEQGSGPTIAAIVAHVDLRIGEAKLKEALAAHAEASEGRLRGIRDAGYTYDSWHYHFQNPEFLELAQATPDTVMILDHFGTPLGVPPYDSQREEIFTQWKKDVAAIAKCENTRAKLGGLAMPDNGFGWMGRAMPPSSDELVAAHADYYHFMIDCFGPDRCMFESNFPVDKLSVAYPILWNALKKIASRYSESEQVPYF